MAAQRKIIHVDCDCFFAAVEMREDPSLRGRPIAVGGSASRRGVIATCNYEARAYGVHSALSTAIALRRCPELLLLPVNLPLYRQVAAEIRSVFEDYSDCIEPLSLDEAYLDVSSSSRCRGSATLIAAEIRARVAAETGVTVSAGVAENKFLAKIASDWRKPDGLTVIRPDQSDDFVARLAVQKLPGVGAVTARKLRLLGIETCADLRRMDAAELGRRFGRFGARLRQFACGEDPRPVSAHRSRKSLSVEHTWPSDLPAVEDCLQRLPRLNQQLRERLRASGAEDRICKQFVKLRFDDFRTTTIECGSRRPRYAVYEKLCREAWERASRPVRLLGLGVRMREGDGVGSQLSLFAAP